jgi:hypothetical protein
MLRIIESGAFSKDFGFYKRREPHPRFVASQSPIERAAPKPKDTKPSGETAEQGSMLTSAMEEHRETTPGRNETIIFTAPGQQETNQQPFKEATSGTK